MSYHYDLWEQKVMHLEVSNATFSEADAPAGSEGRFPFLFFCSFRLWLLGGFGKGYFFEPVFTRKARDLATVALALSVALRPRKYLIPVQARTVGEAQRPGLPRGSSFVSCGILPVDSRTVPWHFHTVLKGREAQAHCHLDSTRELISE